MFIEQRKQYIKHCFKNLNKKQQEAVFTTQGPLLILAGAGSGKTTVLVSRIANLILFGDAYNASEIQTQVTPELLQELQTCTKENLKPSQALSSALGVQKVRPWNIMAITFTNKAADELKHRLDKILGQEVGQNINASTFHSACVRILRRDADKLGFPNHFTIYDADDQKRVLKEIYKTHNIDDKFLPIKSCLGAIGRLKDKMIGPKEALNVAKDTKTQLVAQIYSYYTAYCKNTGALDFDDLIYYTVLLLQEHEEQRQYYQQKFKYVLVDEYQDTSVAQFQLVRLLSAPQNNVCVVGDDDQSIYGFRGATIENILQFESHFPGAKVIRLEQNYRSTSNILNAANSVISHNRGRKGKKLWTNNTDGTKVAYYLAESEQQEAEHMAEIIGQNIKNGMNLSDHAVLYRMNAQSSPIENYFTRAGIPYKMVGGLRFNDRKEIKDLHAYMSILVNPQDDLRLRRIINEPSRKIGAVSLDNIANIATGLGVPMLDIVKHADEYPTLSRVSKALLAFYALYEELQQIWQENSLEEFATQLPELTGYTNMLKAQGEEGKTRLENMGQLISNVKTYADMNGEEASLEGYLEEIALIADIDSYDESAEKVSMMTMHAAKGLEFPYVFIVGLEEGIFPGEMSRWSEEDLEEERRLCYVGITRAKSELYLSSAASRLLFGQTRRNPASRFIEEIAPEYIEQQTAPGIQSPHAYLNTNYNKQGVSTNKIKENLGGRSNLLNAHRKAATSPNVPKPANAAIVYAPGDAVEHKVFGQGIVQKVTPVAGDMIVEIKFEKAGIKKTMANYAPLKKL